jgi:hypothetical protein
MFWRGGEDEVKAVKSSSLSSSNLRSFSEADKLAVGVLGGLLCCCDWWDGFGGFAMGFTGSLPLVATRIGGGGFE